MAVFIILFVVAVTMLLLISYFYSMKIRHGIDLFTNFLRQATDSKKKIKNTDLAFTEFEDLRILANRMVDDRIQKELLLRRDELRLDTLLRLGIVITSYSIHYTKLYEGNLDDAAQNKIILFLQGLLRNNFV